MKSTFWTKEKVNLLRELWSKPDFSINDIATELKTTYDAVKHAIRRYSLSHYRKVHGKDKATSSSMQKILENINPKKLEQLKKKCTLNWKIPKSRNNKDGKIPGWTKYIVVADQHIPKQNQVVVKATLQLMEDEYFDGIIQGGDMMDMECISHWTKNKTKTLENQRLFEDYIIGNQLLDEYDKRLPKDAKKYYFWGNHEDWYNQMIEELPALEGFADPTKELKLVERGYTIFPPNHIEHLGKLAICHGLYTGEDPTKTHLDKLKVNIMFFHTHTQAEKYSSSEARVLSFAGFNVGCQCDLSPDYMKGKAHKWTHGFAILYVEDKTGHFFVDLKRIVQGRFIHNNKIYDGNK